MKILRAFFLSLAIVLIVPSVIHAREIIQEQNGSNCIDLEAVYADINDTSKALTGDENSIDAVKKAQIVSSLTNIMSILVGDQFFCVKDESAAAKVGTLQNVGLLGQLEKANNQMMAFFPSGNVTKHLAEEFVPGYGENNSLIAATIPENNTIPSNNVIPPIDSEIQNANPEDLEAQEGDADEAKWITWFKEKLLGPIFNNSDQRDNIEEMLQENEDNQDAGEQMNMSGYTYLKDKVHIDSIWGFFRNIAYVFFVIVMIITGFMIMFRKELPGQVVVGISNTLPQIILGIILVTFSFAIVGLVMDIGKVSMSVISNVFQNAYEDRGNEIQGNIDDVVTISGLNNLTSQALKSAKGEGLIIQLIRKVPFVGPIAADAITGLGGSLGSATAQGGGIGLTYYLGQVLVAHQLEETAEVTAEEDINLDCGPGVDCALDPVVEGAELFIDYGLTILRTALTVFLIRNILLILVCLYASIKVFITMFTTYLKLFINVVFGPIQIMLGSLPGNFSMTAQWFKSVVANVLVFVGIHLIINLAAYLSAVVDPRAFNFFGNNGTFWPNWIVSLEGIILIGGYLLASNMPQIINGVLKVETSRELAAAGESVKKAASKIPLVGGMFGG